MLDYFIYNFQSTHAVKLLYSSEALELQDGESDHAVQALSDKHTCISNGKTTIEVSPIQYNERMDPELSDQPDTYILFSTLQILQFFTNCFSHSAHYYGYFSVVFEQTLF